jgi:hypothetical protein
MNNWNAIVHGLLRVQFRATGRILYNKQYNVNVLNDVNSKKTTDREKKAVEEKWGGVTLTDIGKKNKIYY